MPIRVQTPRRFTKGAIEDLPSPKDTRPTLRDPVAANRRTATRGLAGYETSLCAQLFSEFANGKIRIRLPVALNIALATAGPIGGTPGSPTPVGGAEDLTM